MELFQPDFTLLSQNDNNNNNVSENNNNNKILDSNNKLAGIIASKNIKNNNYKLNQNVVINNKNNPDNTTIVDIKRIINDKDLKKNSIPLHLHHLHHNHNDINSPTNALIKSGPILQRSIPTIFKPNSSSSSSYYSNYNGTGNGSEIGNVNILNSTNAIGNNSYNINKVTNSINTNTITKTSLSVSSASTASSVSSSSSKLRPTSNSTSNSSLNNQSDQINNPSTSSNSSIKSSETDINNTGNMFTKSISSDVITTTNNNNNTNNMTFHNDSNNVRQIRKKWKEMENIALLKVLLNYSYLLNYVEFFKPMKNFWLKISKVLLIEYSIKRNPRQCHDRFKVLYLKSFKINNSPMNNLSSQSQFDETDNPNHNDSTTIYNNELNHLLLQIRKTFGFSNGNIILKNVHSHKNINNDSSNNNEQHGTNINSSMLDQDNSNINTASMIQCDKKQYMDTMFQSIYNIITNLQNQVDILKNQVDLMDKRYTEQNLMFQNMFFPNSNMNPTANENLNASSINNQNSINLQQQTSQTQSNQTQSTQPQSISQQFNTFMNQYSNINFNNTNVNTAVNGQNTNQSNNIISSPTAYSQIPSAYQSNHNSSFSAQNPTPNIPTILSRSVNPITNSLHKNTISSNLSTSLPISSTLRAPDVIIPNVQILSTSTITKIGTEAENDDHNNSE
ncbi:hypothetical protein TBLA_0E03820 [Henningerozyma blattae CBS 6284]|uniref:Myb-like domain-containing protein n=1 Tax=Henningerozyma blattae (strain ATCC 34711 / CBS 6284 / DSM 70876 / NBRC 10599 / NRRL Y-10934 / UCD 77-7) TaxID=1071380 RepID=I2H4Y4_HENB6|nr:hypothetical protein TBLA_0E03820 [Tetrapisispora blattae CBS 6284]CCH61436.1 hypothetical protein TBLA_0E03820 [Tetrapisispora blattae CBS 6284]